MSKPGTVTGGKVIDGGDTSADITTAPIVHLGPDTVFSVQAHAPALAGRSGTIHIRASVAPDAQVSKALWPLVADISVTNAALDSLVNTPLTGAQYVWVEYERSGGGAASDLDVWVSVKRIGS